MLSRCPGSFVAMFYYLESQFKQWLQKLPVTQAKCSSVTPSPLTLTLMLYSKSPSTSAILHIPILIANKWQTSLDILGDKHLELIQYFTSKKQPRCRLSMCQVTVCSIVLAGIFPSSVSNSLTGNSTQSVNWLWLYFPFALLRMWKGWHVFFSVTLLWVCIYACIIGHIRLSVRALYTLVLTASNLWDCTIVTETDNKSGSQKSKHLYYTISTGLHACTYVQMYGVLVAYHFANLKSKTEQNQTTIPRKSLLSTKVLNGADLWAICPVQEVK